MLPLRLPLRLAARVTQTPSRLVRQSIAIAPSQLPRLSFNISRGYASPGRPKKATSDTEKGKPKKSTKSAASIKPKTKTKTKTNATAPKKAAEKVYTPEQLQAKKDKATAAAKKVKIEALKEAALPAPSPVHTHTFIIFHGDRIKGQKRSEQNTFADMVRESSRLYHNLSSQEREHWNHIANQKNLRVDEEYRKFVESHTPDQIRLANSVRRRLRFLLPASAKKFPPIRDDRLVKHPVSSYLQFATGRITSGDFRGIRSTQASKDIAEEWKALSSAEKQIYVDLAAKDLERYKREYFEVYGHEVVPARSTNVE